MAYKIKKDPISEIPKLQFIFWLIVRLVLIGCMIYSGVKHEYTIMGESIAAFCFTFLWDLFQIFGNGSFIEEVPPLNQTMLNFIILIGIFFGTYLNFFEKFMWYDEFMHILSGVTCAIFGYDMAFIIQRKKGMCAYTLAGIFAFCFVMLIAGGWEFYEFLEDYFHDTNLQLSKAGPETAMYDISKFRGEYGYLGLVDTMKDMMMNAVGGMAGMIFAIIYRMKHPSKAMKMAMEAEKQNLNNE